MEAYSVRIASTDGADAAWTQTVQVEQFTEFTLSGWIKTENVSAGSGYGAQFNVHELGQESLTVAVTGTEDWTYVEQTVETRDQTEVQINALLGGWGQSTGTAWFDAVAFEGPSGENLLTNADFEDGTQEPWETMTWGGSADLEFSDAESFADDG